jgi:hypothetical protein
VLDVDVPAVTVGGTVTLNGAALPVEAMSRGSVGVARTASEAGGMVSFALGTNAAPSYAATVTAGHYLFSHVANAALCTPGRALPGVPCASQVVTGCP